MDRDVDNVSLRDCWNCLAGAFAGTTTEDVDGRFTALQSIITLFAHVENKPRRDCVAGHWNFNFFEDLLWKSNMGKKLPCIGPVKTWAWTSVIPQDAKGLPFFSLGWPVETDQSNVLVHCFTSAACRLPQSIGGPLGIGTDVSQDRLGEAYQENLLHLHCPLVHADLTYEYYSVDRFPQLGLYAHEDSGSSGIGYRPDGPAWVYCLCKYLPEREDLPPLTQQRDIYMDNTEPESHSRDVYLAVIRCESKIHGESSSRKVYALILRKDDELPAFRRIGMVILKEDWSAYIMGAGSFSHLGVLPYPDPYLMEVGRGRNTGYYTIALL